MQECLDRHANRNLVVVRKIVRFLQTAGLETWFDKENLLGGQEWKRRLRMLSGVAACLSLRLPQKHRIEPGRVSSCPFGRGEGDFAIYAAFCLRPDALKRRS
jgi:hypothetical protein